MLLRIAYLVTAFALSTVLIACSASAPPRYYSLNAAATASGLPATGGNVAIGPVTVPASVDQPQFVTQESLNRVDVDEFNRWSAPLNENIARVVAQNLVMLLGTPDVAVAPLANFTPDYFVAIDVQRFESVRGHRTELDAVWTIRDKVRGITQSGRTNANEAVADDSFDALAAAHSRALAMLSDDIAKAIRADAVNQSQFQSDPRP